MLGYWPTSTVSEKVACVTLSSASCPSCFSQGRSRTWGSLYYLAEWLSWYNTDPESRDFLSFLCDCLAIWAGRQLAPWGHSGNQVSSIFSFHDPLKYFFFSMVRVSLGHIYVPMTGRKKESKSREVIPFRRYSRNYSKHFHLHFLDENLFHDHTTNLFKHSFQLCSELSW